MDIKKKMADLVVPSPSLLACPVLNILRQVVCWPQTSRILHSTVNVEVDFNKTPESKYLIQSFPNSKLSIYRLNVKLFLPMLCPSVRRIHDDLPVSGCIGREIWFQSSLSN